MRREERKEQEIHRRRKIFTQEEEEEEEDDDQTLDHRQNKETHRSGRGGTDDAASALKREFVSLSTILLGFD